MSIFHERIETLAGTLLVTGCLNKANEYAVNVSFAPEGSDYCTDVVDVLIAEKDPREIEANVYTDVTKDEPQAKFKLNLNKILEFFKEEGYLDETK